MLIEYTGPHVLNPKQNPIILEPMRLIKVVFKYEGKHYLLHTILRDSFRFAKIPLYFKGNLRFEEQIKDVKKHNNN